MRKEEINISGQAWNLGHIGENYILQNNWKKAIELLDTKIENLENIIKEFGDAVVYSERHQGQVKAFEVGNRLFHLLKERVNEIDTKLALMKLFANWLNMKVSLPLFKDLAGEALAIFSESENRLIISAALNTILYIEKDKAESYLEDLNPDMTIAVKAITKEAKF